MAWKALRVKILYNVSFSCRSRCIETYFLCTPWKSKLYYYSFSKGDQCFQKCILLFHETRSISAVSTIWKSRVRLETLFRIVKTAGLGLISLRSDMHFWSHWPSFWEQTICRVMSKKAELCRHAFWENLCRSLVSKMAKYHFIISKLLDSSSVYESSMRNQTKSTLNLPTNYIVRSV